MARGGFPGGGGMNMQNMMKQAQAMQQKILKVQEELEETEIETTAGGGMIRVTMSGSGTLKDIEINPEVVDPDDIEMLQDLVVAAVNEGIQQVNTKREEDMARVTGGMNLGGLF